MRFYSVDLLPAWGPPAPRRLSAPQGKHPACFVHCRRPSTQPEAWRIVGTQQSCVKCTDEGRTDGKPARVHPELDGGVAKTQRRRALEEEQVCPGCSAALGRTRGQEEPHILPVWAVVGMGQAEGAGRGGEGRGLSLRCGHRRAKGRGTLGLPARWHRGRGGPAAGPQSSRGPERARRTKGKCPPEPHAPRLQSRGLMPPWTAGPAPDAPRMSPGAVSVSVCGGMTRPWGKRPVRGVHVERAMVLAKSVGRAVPTQGRKFWCLQREPEPSRTRRPLRRARHSPCLREAKFVPNAPSPSALPGKLELLDP